MPDPDDAGGRLDEFELHPWWKEWGVWVGVGALLMYVAAFAWALTMDWRPVAVLIGAWAIGSVADKALEYRKRELEDERDRMVDAFMGDMRDLARKN